MRDLSEMRIVVVVSEFPKVTETFALLNILHYLSAGHEVSLFHIKPFRTAEIIHDEARPVVDRAFTYPWFSGAALWGLASAILTRPVRLLSIIAHLFKAFWREPKRLAASLALLPKATALGRHAYEAGTDHIHAEFASHPATTAWIAYRLYDVPFSFSAHMHDIFVSQNLLANKSRDACFVRTISNFNIRKLTDISGFDAEKLRLVRCGVDLKKFRNTMRDPKHVVENFQILFVGSLQERKGCALLAQALRRIGEDWPWHLDVIGDGPERSTIETLGKELPEGSLSLHGAKSSLEVRDALAQAHLLVLPSLEGRGGRSEGIPIVLMEAAASGCPVISSRISGIPELIEDGVTGLLIEPRDVEGLAKVIAETRADYPAALKRAGAARQRVEREYDIDKNAPELLELMVSS